MAPTLRALPNPRRKPSNRPVRAASRVESYREDSDTDDANLRLTLRPRSQSESTEHNSVQNVRTPVKPIATKVTRSSSSRVKRSLFSQASRALQVEFSPKKRKVTESAPATATTGVVPPWQSLPFHILVEIFFYATGTVTDDPTRDVTKDVKWLLGVSRLCRAFFEPAITVLYYAPPVNSPAKLLGLLALLERDSSGHYSNYKSKIKRLDMSTGLPQGRYSEYLRLVALTPNLRYLRIYDPTEYGQAKRALPTSLLNELLSLLDSNRCRLLHFEWNKRQIPRPVEAVHMRPSFESLQSLRIYNLEFEDFGDEYLSAGPGKPSEKTLAEDMAVALSRLENLRHLSLANCEIVGYSFLLSLPTKLRTISFSTCWGLTSDILERFLMTHGGYLRRLVLRNNRELNMTFTTRLREFCPNLEVFTMDLNFSSLAQSSWDVEHHFENLFDGPEPPSWPPSLQVLHLERLRKWDVDTAERFFNNLIESAPSLMNLRTLIITAILNINWRDRASLREKYVRTLQRTFLRKSAPPSQGQAEQARQRQVDGDPSPTPTLRKSSRLQALHDKMDVQISDPSDTATHQDSDIGFVQGLCNTVEVRIDNLRPADVLLTVDSFQDEEPSSDEEWNGQDIDLDEEYAW
ncbi:hypothetical protein VTO42DRAFT_3305 [Malbranchea cinnamomea]